MTESTPRLRITSRSGKVKVAAVPGAALAVTGGRAASEEDGVVEIRPDGSSTLEIACPAGSDLTISTGSGNIDVRGDAGSVKVITRSGSLRIEHATAVDARGASGKVEVGACSGECHVAYVSSDVRIGSAGRAVVATTSGDIEVGEAGDAEVKTVSGKITLGGRGGGRLAARTISGSVSISVPEGSRPTTRLKSLSGRVRCECESGENGDDGEIKASTVSGTVTVRCR